MGRGVGECLNCRSDLHSDADSDIHLMTFHQKEEQKVPETWLLRGTEGWELTSVALGKICRMSKRCNG
jgi:hypothetical protein